MPAKTHRLPLVGALLIGVGLALAPVAFQMFHRAPLGGVMIDEFRPYMTQQQLDDFRGYMGSIDAAVDEIAELRSSLAADGTIDGATFDTQFVLVRSLTEQWDAIQTDMNDLLDRMDDNLDNYAAVAALPPFWMFPWFFVVPGVLIAGVAGSALWSAGKGRTHRRRSWALVVLGVGLIAAPLAFQMFTRAPKGGEMIDDFRPMMTHERVQAVQGYFVTLGAGEGQLRVGALPEYVAAGGRASDLPAIESWSQQWPTIVGEFNPMIAAMSDNIDNFEAVDAMPSFPLFPWFFVIPGALVVVLAALTLRRTLPQPDSEVRT